LFNRFLPSHLNRTALTEDLSSFTDIMDTPQTDERPGAETSHSELLAYLDTLNWGAGQRDDTGYKAALRAASFNIDPQKAVDEIAQRIRAAGGTFTPSKLESQVRRAYAFVKQAAIDSVQVIQYPVAPFDPEALQKLADKAPHVTAHWLKAASPIPPDGLTPIQILHHLYDPGETILIFENQLSQGDWLIKIGDKLQPPLKIDSTEGAWFLANPVDGQNHPNPRNEGKESRRSEEAVTAWRYLLLESDVAPADQWLKALVQLPLKISAIYSSGGKSIHALVRLDAQSKHGWDQQRDQLRALLTPIGADPQAMTAVRLTRLPNVMRGTRLQKLLYGHLGHFGRLSGSGR